MVERDIWDLHSIADYNTRRKAISLPLGPRIYGGMGYILPNKKYWTSEKLAALKEWGVDYDIIFDGPVVVFPDEETYVLFKLTWE